MSVVAVRPSSTTSNTGVTIAGSSLHAVLGDDSDGTYGEWAAGDTAVVAFTAPTLPSGSVIKSQGVRARTAKISANGLMGVQALGDIYPDTGDAAWTVASGISWTTPTTVSLPIPLQPDHPMTGLRIFTGAPDVVARVFEAYLDVVYVVKPVISVQTPTGTVTNTNKPRVQWSFTTHDTDGGSITTWQVKVFTAAQYGAGGFDPATSTTTQASGITNQLINSWDPPVPLANATYRAYVRVAQNVNGSLFWSDWAYSAFVLNVTPPNAPTVAAIAQNTEGRIRLTVTPAATGVSTDLIEAQRSADNGATWEDCRTEPAGLTVATSVKVWDFEAPNGTAMLYRARTAHSYSGVYAYTAWVTSSPVAWSSTDRWIKHPNLPALNMKVTVQAFGAVKRAARQGVFQALGAADAIVVSDTRGPETGGLILLLADQAARDQLDALLDTADTLLLQGATGDSHLNEDRYLSFGDHDRAPVIDHAWAPKTKDTIAWTRVAKPAGDLTYPAGIS
jgi:hypothetical protein